MHAGMQVFLGAHLTFASMACALSAGWRALIMTMSWGLGRRMRSVLLLTGALVGVHMDFGRTGVAEACTESF